jgi:hypothetical protein
MAKQFCLLVAASFVLLSGCSSEKLADTNARQKHDSHFISELTRANLSEHGKEIEEFVGSVKGVTREQAEIVFFAVAEGCPDATLQRQMDVAKNVAPLVITLEEAQFKELCVLCGKIAVISPEKSADDVADVGLAVYQKFQKYTRKGPSSKVLNGVRTLVECKACSTEEAFGMAIAIVEKGGDADTIESVAKAVSTGQPVRN